MVNQLFLEQAKLELANLASDSSESAILQYYSYQEALIAFGLQGC